MTSVYIYALEDPIDGLIKYIGASQHPARRLAEHLTTRREVSAKTPWVNGLTAMGLAPKLVTLECCLAGDIYPKQREGWWVKDYLERGHPLLNTFAPGYGRLRPTPLKGRKRDPAQVAATALSNRKPHQGGWHQSEKFKEAMSKRRQLPDQTLAEIRLRLTTDETVTSIAKACHVTRNTVFNIRTGRGSYAQR